MYGLQDSSSQTYANDRVNELLTEKAMYESWLKMEAELAQAQAKYGMIPQDAADVIYDKAKIENIDLEEIAVIKEEIGHGFMPFVKVFSKVCGEAGKYVHFGVTTQNIQQSGQLYLVKQINQEFKKMLSNILNNFAKLAEEHAHTVMPGRTHGRHAVPITFGYKVSAWIYELRQAIEALLESEKRIFQIMMGGAVGSFNTFPETGRKVQKEVAKSLGMYEMEVPSRNINSHKEEYMMRLAQIANVLHKMAEEVYYTGLEEIGELQESFKGGTVGSSTMPHKINPKLAKGIVSNAQKLYSILTPGLYSNVRLFEGDSSSYLLFDHLMIESLSLMNEILIRAEALSHNLEVDVEKMKGNAHLNQGLDNAEYIMMELAKKIGKNPAHELVYELAMKVENEGANFLDLLQNEERLNEFTDEELKALIQPENYIGLCPDLAKEQADAARKLAKEMN